MSYTENAQKDVVIHVTSKKKDGVSTIYLKNTISAGSEDDAKKVIWNTILLKERDKKILF